MSRRWVARAVGTHRGALHRALHVPLGSKIPAGKLRTAAKAPGKLGRRARFALELRGFRHRGR